MKFVRIVLSTFLFLLPFSLFADLEGNYLVKGENPQGTEYTATLLITRQGEVYIAEWTFSDGTTDIGTGVRRDDEIAFVFLDTDTGIYGVQLYEIHGVLKGPWSNFGSIVTGKEKAIKIPDTSNSAS